MTIGAPTEVSQQILCRVREDLALSPDISLAYVDVQQTRNLHEIQRETGTMLTDLTVAVLKPGLAAPGERFLRLVIEVGIRAYHQSCSVAQDNCHSGISASTKQIKSQSVSNLFDHTHPDYIFSPCRGAEQEILDEMVMVMLCDLRGYGTDAWKKTKDAMLTLRAIADRTVDITFEELVRGSKMWE